MQPLLLTNAHVVTLDADLPCLGGLRVADGRVTDVWTAREPKGLVGQRRDLGGAYIIPGLVDAHLHLQALGASARELDLRGTTSLADVLAQVDRASRAAPGDAWLRGRGWDQNAWPEQRFPSAADLDQVAAHRPVWLERVDGHAVWLNTKAMAKAGIRAGTVSSEGGEILRDYQGVPTGVFVDSAMSRVAQALPDTPSADLRRDLECGLALAAGVGLTGVHDMGTTPHMLRELEALAVEDALPVRVTAYLLGTDHELAPLLARRPWSRGLLHVGGVKLYADGALGSRGAALLAPYSDCPKTSGLLIAEPQVLAARVCRIHDAGFQVAIHAIGDRGVRVALDAVAAARRAERSRRHRIEHAQVVAIEDVGRFGALGAIASMQPVHCTSDAAWVESRLGEVRKTGAYAWRTLVGAGTSLAFGSDAPVESVSPWLGLYAAVTRQTRAGEPPGGFVPSERLSPREALWAYTRGAALAAGDADLGVIKVGARADLTILDRDPERVAPRELFEVRVLERIVGGRVWEMPTT